MLDDISPSIDFFTIIAFVSENAIIKIYLAFKIVYIPIEIAYNGTFSSP